MVMVQSKDGQWVPMKVLLDQSPNCKMWRLSAKIDIILGADIYGSLLWDGIMPSQNGSPMGQHTELT